MNKKLEQDLIGLAFDELSPEKANSVETRVHSDSRSAGTLNEYRQLAAEVQRLKDVPAHQLSNERLRDAILREGMKPDRIGAAGDGSNGFSRRWALHWAWAPAAAFALAYVFVLSRRASVAGPARIEGLESAVALSSRSNLTHQEPFAIETPGKTPDLFAADHFVGDAFAESWKLFPISSKADGESGAQSRLTGHRRTGKAKVESAPGPESAEDMLQHHADQLVAMSGLGPASNIDESADRGPESSSQTNASATRVQEYSPPSASVSDEQAEDRGRPIVMIDADSDKSTGAQRATEVDSTSNVLVGG